MKKFFLNTLAICTLLFSLFSVNTIVSANPVSSVDSDTIVVNNIKLQQYPITINNCILVPARAVAEQLGFSIQWDNATQSATIIGNSMKTKVTIAQDLYFASSISAIGMTNPTPLGAAPVLINNQLYIPVELFRLIQGNAHDALTITDHQLIFKTIN